MSQKYQRIKQEDLLLPAPLRWLTRAFSSITMAVILLGLISLYAIIATIPLGLLAKAVGYGLIVLTACGLPGYVGWRIIRLRGWRWKILGLLVIHTGMPLAAWGCRQYAAGLAQSQWFDRYQQMLFYRLPGIEMTEMQFYGTWPMQLLLGLLVINMIWATVRRIEFTWLNLGVLSVHGGIVLIAAGSIVYSAMKVEGDAILWRSDLGGQSVSEFYDKSEPAIYFTLEGKTFFVPVPKLPRYNDYAFGRLNIPLHEDAYFRKFLGTDLKATIAGFIAYGQLHSVWQASSPQTPPADSAHPPEPGAYPDGHFGLTVDHAMQLGMSVSGNAGDAKPVGPMLFAAVPAKRVMENNFMGIEYLRRPSPGRLADLQATFDGPHGLIVEIPAAGHRSVHAIAAGQAIELPGTGYRLEVTDIGPYPILFVTPGYEDASDTQATVRIAKPDGTIASRMVMYRYPERSQDFAPAASGASPATGMGSLGRRSDPDPAIRLVYIDASKTQFHLIQDATASDGLRLLSRAAKSKPGDEPVVDRRFALSDPHGQRQVWFHVLKQYDRAASMLRPQVTPWNQRNPKDEGTYLYSLVPLVLQWPSPEGTGQASQVIWLPFMRYPMWPDEEHFPIRTTLADGRELQIAFSRLRLPLPFRMTLRDFTMTPYPGTQMPRDFASVLELVDRDRPGESVVGASHLNHPLIHRGYKISQSGWDPGDASDPQKEEKNADGRFVRQQRYTIVGIGNNVAIQVIFVGSALAMLGIPWAFYVKPAIQQKRKAKIQSQLAANRQAGENPKESA